MYQTMYKMAGCPAVAKAASFSDVFGQWYAAAVADWAKDGMERTVALGILSGRQNKLNPAGTAQRFALAQILMDFGAISFETPAEDYLTGIGLTAEQISALKTVLPTPIAQ